MNNLNEREQRELRERQLNREVQVNREVQLSRDSENTTNGLLLGVLLAVTAGLVTLFFALNQRTPTQAPAQPPQVNVQPPEVNVQVSPQAPAPQVTSPDAANSASRPVAASRSSCAQWSRHICASSACSGGWGSDPALGQCPKANLKI
jgi:hypothetical protein